MLELATIVWGVKNSDAASHQRHHIDLHADSHTGRRLPKIVLACAAFALAAAVAAQGHPVTGIYSYDGPDLTRTVEIHVAPDGTLTGTSRSSRNPSGTYLQGRYENGRAAGTYYDTTTLLHITFLFEFHQDVLTYYLYAGSVDEPPDPLPEPTFLLRQPGTGPTEPLQAPLTVLVAQDADDTAMATGSSGVTLRLGDARRFLDLLGLAFGEAGIDNALFPNRRIYVDWLSRAKRVFEGAPHATQLLLADSATWWPPLRQGWAEAPPEQRRRVAEDALLLLFETAAATGDQALLDASLEAVADGCDSLSCRAFSLFDEQSLAAARARQPCFGLGGCEGTCNPERHR